MRPEMPYLAAGIISLTASVKREGGFPSNGVTAVIATVALVIVASATANSRVAPIVRAIGLLLLMAAIMAAAPTLTSKGKNHG